MSTPAAPAPPVPPLAAPAVGAPPPSLLAALRAVAAEAPDAEARIAALEALPPGPAARLAAGFADALRARRGGGADTGNLYVGEAGPAEMLAAFEALVRATPLVRFGHEAANTALLAAAEGADALCVVDVGLGGGAQWEGFLASLAARPGGPPHVRLVGIDLPATDGRAPDADLRATGVRLGALAARLGVPYTFEALPGRIEDVPLPAPRPDERLLVNAAFALHHTASGDARGAGPDRDAVLARLAGSGAHALVLTEPEADHDAPGFVERGLAAWRHYGMVFTVLERCLADRPAPRATIERAFFGREIHNVVGGEGPARRERHAPHVDWVLRLVRAGFVPRVASAVPELPLPSGVTVERGAEVVRLRVDGDVLVNVSAWSPGA